MSLALSSTTLEQALYYSIPSMSYGYSNYNHFNYYQKNNKYRINRKLKDYFKLKEIEKILKRRFMYLDKKEIIRKKVFMILFNKNKSYLKIIGK